MTLSTFISAFDSLAVVPVLVGPLQVLLAILPYIFLALFFVLLSLFRPRTIKQGIVLLWRVKLPLAAVAAVVLLGYFGLKNLLPASGPEAGEAETSSDDWQMFRGSLARRGTVLGSAEPVTSSVRWAYQRDNVGFFSSPAVVGNRVYVTSAELGAFRQSGSIFCFDADTGAVVWNSAPKNYRPTFSSPAVSENYLVCGEGLHDTSDARVVCLDVSPQGKGRVLWTHATASHVECTPVIAGGRVYVGAGDDGYYCLHLKPQPAGKSQLVWHLPGEKYPDAETSLAVHDGKVYAGLGQGGRAICVLDAATGRQLHRLDTPFPVFGPPAIDRGKLYVAMGNGDYVHTAEEAAELQLERLRQQNASPKEIEAAGKALAPAGEVWCVDLTSLQVDWKCPLPRTVLGAVAVTDDALYCGSRDGRLYAISHHGRILASYNVHAPIIASPAVTAGLVYVASQDGRLHALNRRTLDLMWEVTVSTQPLCISSPTIARGHVYLGTQADGFLCVGAPASGTSENIVLWPGRLGGPGRGGCLDDSPFPPFVSVRWRFPASNSDDPPHPSNVIAAPIAAVPGNIVVPVASGQSAGVFCLPGQTATEGVPQPQWHFALPNGVHSSPAVAGQRVFFVDGIEGMSGRELHCVDLSSGRRQWVHPIEANAAGALLATAHALYVSTAQDRIGAFSHEGRVLWERTLGAITHEPSAKASMLVVATVDPPELVALDGPTGIPLWRREIDALPTTSPLVLKTHVFLGTTKGLWCASLVDGTPVAGWKRPDDAPVSCGLVAGPDWIGYVSGRGDVLIVVCSDGRVMRRIAGAAAGTSLVFSRGTLLYQSADGWLTFRVDVADEEPQLWLEMSELGQPSSPPVLNDACMYVGDRGRGLMCVGASP